MDLTSRALIKTLFRRYKIRPLKKFGQNFLIDKDILKQIVEAADISPEEVILEIGPGIGNLTQELAKKAKKVVTIEKDQKMVEILKEVTKNFQNIKIIERDILKIDPKSYLLNTKSYKIVANLPYYIVSPVIRKFLESKFPPKEMILMAQKEVAQRICAKPPDMNLLAISVQFYARPEIVSYVSKKSFWPQPKVDGAILKISKIKNQKSKINKNLFFKIVRAGFSHPRKQILNNLSKGLALSLPNGLKLEKEQVRFWLLKNGVQPNQRAETLKIEDWIKLAKSMIAVKIK